MPNTQECSNAIWFALLTLSLITPIDYTCLSSKLIRQLTFCLMQACSDADRLAFLSLLDMCSSKRPQFEPML